MKIAATDRRLPGIDLVLISATSETRKWKVSWGGLGELATARSSIIDSPPGGFLAPLSRGRGPKKNPVPLKKEVLKRDLRASIREKLKGNN